jgi:hypothetical protein
MKKIVFYTCCSVLAFASIVLSCSKSEFRGCNNGKLNVECTINGSKFVADSVAAGYDTINHKLYIYAKDSSEASTILFTIHNSVTTMDVPLKSIDSVYSGQCTGIYKGRYFNSSYGNFGMDKNTDNTLCGQFFMQDLTQAISISVGKFSQVPYTNF